MTDRRYTDEEMRAIFAAAAESLPSAPQLADEQDLTLADLQAIGKEVGLTPEAVAQAARTLDVRRVAVSRTLLGLPIGVERSVTLNRRLTDDEWERLVVELREVFKARGSTRSDGSLRQWTNGNLYALLEPVATGHRLRFGSMHGGARASVTMGFAALGVAATAAIATAVTGTLGNAVPLVSYLLGVGVTLVAIGAARLPRWARLRGQQMEALAARLALSAGSNTPPAQIADQND